MKKLLSFAVALSLIFTITLLPVNAESVDEPVFDDSAALHVLYPTEGKLIAKDGKEITDKEIEEQIDTLFLTTGTISMEDMLGEYETEADALAALKESATLLEIELTSTVFEKAVIEFSAKLYSEILEIQIPFTQTTTLQDVEIAVTVYLLEKLMDIKFPANPTKEQVTAKLKEIIKLYGAFDSVNTDYTMTLNDYSKDYIEFNYQLFDSSVMYDFMTKIMEYLFKMMPEDLEDYEDIDDLGDMMPFAIPSDDENEEDIDDEFEILPSEIKSIKVNGKSVEDLSAGKFRVPVVAGENKIKIEVTSFDGTQDVSSVYNVVATVKKLAAPPTTTDKDTDKGTDKEETDNPKTGESSLAIMASALLMISLAAAVVSKKRKVSDVL